MGHKSGTLTAKHQGLVDEPPLQALAGHVGAEDLQVLAARSLQCRGEKG